MKKFLLGTTALFGAAALFGADAEAAAPKVTLGGQIKTIVGVNDDDAVDGGATRSNAIFTDSEINVSVDGKSDAGLGYGAVIDLEADVTGDSRGEGLNASRTYVYLEGTWGRFEIGSNQGPSSTMKVDAGTIASATGGISGDFREFVSTSTLANDFVVARPDLPLAYGLGDGGAIAGNDTLGDDDADNANKLTYYTPKYMGLQAGLSYIPSSSSRGQTIDFSKDEAGSANPANEADDIFDFGLSYDRQFDQVALAASFTAQYGTLVETNPATADDIEAWAAGLSIGFAGFEIAGSYADWQNSFIASTADETEFYTLGAAYDFGPFSASITYMDSEFGTGTGTANEFENVVIGADYKLAPGLVPFAEVAFFEATDGGTTPANDNEGTVFLLGTELTF